METFIREIYREADIIESIKEYISLTNSGCLRDARTVYNSAACEMESMLDRISTFDIETASRIQEIAISIKDSFEDFCLAKGLAEGRLLPELYSYMKQFTSIDVTEGKYSLKSSDTGYLTIRDNDINLYLHDIHDPMWEAHEVIRSIYKPDMETFLIFGCGLGYYAYQVFHQSEGAVKIYLYEDDKTMLDYAYAYGVLSLIPDESIIIVYDKDYESLVQRFVADKESLHAKNGLFFSDNKKTDPDGISNSEISRIVVNNALHNEMSKRSLVNLWKNSRLKRISFEDLKNQLHFDEWIIISAGPSFDDCISFMKRNKGKKGLIAVNTVLRRLLREDIIPDAVTAADQYSQMVEHLEGIKESTTNIPLVADWLLCWKYAELYHGPICFVRTNNESELSEQIVPDDPVWDISGTVACLAVEAVIRLGAKRIFLVGQDLSYPGGARYAKGMPHNTSKGKGNISVPSVDGGMVETCEAFYWFIKSLENQIMKNTDIEFINMSAHGAHIDGTTLYSGTY